MKASIYGILS